MSVQTETALLDVAAIDEVPAATEVAPGAPTTNAPRPGVTVSTVVRRGVLLLGVLVLAFVVFALWFSGLAHARSQVGLQRRFAVELESAAAPIGGIIAPGAPVADLRIARIHVHEVVVEGTRSGELRAGPGHLVGSSLPGQPGNAVIAGRHTLYGGPFRRIGALRPGDTIEVVTGQGHATYHVTGAARVRATNGAIVADYGDNRLTLFTADPALVADRRLVVTAALVGPPYAATALKRSLDPDGLGLTGERDAIAVVLVWLELLLVLVLLAVFVRSRWSWISTWVIFAPPIALLTWFVFENAVRLLPATL